MGDDVEDHGANEAAVDLKDFRFSLAGLYVGGHELPAQGPGDEAMRAAPRTRLSSGRIGYHCLSCSHNHGKGSPQLRVPMGMGEGPGVGPNTSDPACPLRGEQESTRRGAGARIRPWVRG